MKKALKIGLIVLGVLILGVGGLLTYVSTALPNVGEASNLKVPTDSATIARGKYLATSVAVCIDCHSERDWTKFAGPPIETTLGQGGEEFSQKFGFPGFFTSKNITPYGVGSWTDGELQRAIASGVSKDGRALFPIMPHPNYGKMDESDINAIIAYVRTLKPIKKDNTPSKPDFPMNFILNTIPQKAQFSVRPSPDDKEAYGKYLFTVASCNECHTKQDKGKPVEGMELAGGFELPLPKGGVVRSANITPDPETGIGNWSEAAFVNRFKTYADSAYHSPEMKDGDFNTYMPWTMYAQMEKKDLEAIYAYLRTVKPVKNKVERFSPAAK